MGVNDEEDWGSRLIHVLAKVIHMGDENIPHPSMPNGIVNKAIWWTRDTVEGLYFIIQMR